MDFSAVIVAAGSGARAGSGLAKQWRSLAGRPVLRWSAEGLAAAGAKAIVVVAPFGELDLAREILKGLEGISVVCGGETRALSVQAGLAVLGQDTGQVVLVHDAARPFVSSRHVQALLDALETADGAVPVLPVSDTLKREDANGALGTAPRLGLLRAQTPQAFRLGELGRAYRLWTGEGPPTDDAEAVEAAGGLVVPVPGDPMLMKLTYPEDFALAERLAGQARAVRIGQGFDAHRFGAGDEVWLCGVRIAHAHGLVGHSDADVGLHALTDALLGAVGRADIGEHFPPSDPRWKGAASDRFVRHAVDLVRQVGGRVVNADVTLICEAPRIRPHREAMRARIAELLGVPVDRVSVKATTTEGMGFTGRGEGLAAQAAVSVEAPI